LYFKKRKQVVVRDGQRVVVKVDTSKYKGALSVVNDSTISSGNSDILLKDIDMITNPKFEKTIGLTFASLPLLFTGVIMIGIVDLTAEPLLYPAGVTIIAGTLTALVIESRIGKRYHAYSRGRNDGTLDRKWLYSIE
jgi:hypothetical protein